MKPFRYRLCIVAWCMWVIFAIGIGAAAVSDNPRPAVAFGIAGMVALTAVPGLLLQYLLVGFWSPRRLWGP